MLPSERLLRLQPSIDASARLASAGHEPLHPFLVFRTSDIDTLRLAAVKKFGATRIDIPDAASFEARASLVELPSIALAFGATNSRTVIEHPEADYARLQISLKGAASTTAARSTVDIHDRQACMTSAGHSSLMDCDAGHERLTLRVDSSALDRKLESLLGARPSGRLEFEAALSMELPRAQMLLRMLLFLARELELNASRLPELVMAELEQSIVVAVLTAHQHSLTHQLERPSRDPAPWQVRRAEEYIIANADRAILIEELAALTGVSARSLFRAFRQSRGCTPMAFAKLVRLQRARDILATANSTTSVTGTAFKCGFSNLGHFARNYQQAFGERPSDTLARGLRRPP